MSKFLLTFQTIGPPGILFRSPASAHRRRDQVSMWLLGDILFQSWSDCISRTLCEDLSANGKIQSLRVKCPRVY